MIKKELVRFALVGVSTVTMAYIIYRSLVFAELDKDIANGIAYSVGVCVSFFANRSWTFSKKTSNYAMLRFIVLHIFSLFACVFVNSIAFLKLDSFEHQLEIAFFFGIATSTSINFIGMKYFVFTRQFRSR